MKLSKGLRRAIEKGAVPPVRGKVKDYKPKDRGTRRSATKSGSVRQDIVNNSPWISMHMSQ